MKPESAPLRERLAFLFSDTTDDATDSTSNGRSCASPCPSPSTRPRRRAPTSTRPSTTPGGRISPRRAGCSTTTATSTQALGYIDTSIAIKPTWWNNWVKAQILAKQGKHGGGRRRGRAGAGARQRRSGVRGFLQGPGRPRRSPSGRRSPDVLPRHGRGVTPQSTGAHRDAGRVPRIFEAYLSGAPAHSSTGTTRPGRRAAVARAARPLAPAVADALEAQNARAGAEPARARLIWRRCAAAPPRWSPASRSACSSARSTRSTRPPPRCAARAPSRRRRASRWCRCSGCRREDHDLPEIAVCHVPGAARHAAHAPSSRHRPTSTSRSPTARCPQDITTCIAQLRDELVNLPHAEHAPDAPGAALPSGRRLGRRLRRPPRGALRAEGLVLLNPRDPALAAAAAPIHRRALSAAEPIGRGAARTRARPAAAGFAPAVHVRAGAPLSFFHPDGAARPAFVWPRRPAASRKSGGEDATRARRCSPPRRRPAALQHQRAAAPDPAR